MFKKFLKSVGISFLLVFASLFFVFFVQAQEDLIPVLYENNSENINIYFFGREDCSFCQKEKVFLDKYKKTDDINIIYHDIVADKESKGFFEQVVEKNNLPKVVPLTLVGGKIIQGYNSDSTTGEKIKEGVELAKNSKNYEVEQYLNLGEVIQGGLGCDDKDEEICEVNLESNFIFELPFLGVVDLEKFSLFTLSSVLGVIDGFNPCALWVLMTFLLLLMQIKNRKKLLYVAGLFLLAEAVMYYLILNVWYKTWDFIGLDVIVTPLIGLLAIGSGIYFIRKYFKLRKQFICDVTDLEHQNKVEQKISKLVNAPLTIITAFGIIGIALSVNVIEFACSIGIPQAFTKILELNTMSFLTHQWYLFVYIIGYMLDDLIVFAFAYYGINKINASQKYSKYATLLGGVLMILLGLILTLEPSLLVL